ncbi:hypothetical protein WICPIJ_004890 [Wickerhamomyces pijperi]|uniref:RING-CH-type domain-containing protein n=1 Tax=Wickerhamomyces pijperi TaxID=599730 RepID=A0A9P8Q722_WICPI|nr:hypothetical protein WICPIJ_004890 [Wickerhamomyces pijperi]
MSSVTTESEQPDNCWICLDSSTTNKKTNPLIQCCDCNLYAHKKCILNWASSVSLQHVQDQGENTIAADTNENIPGFLSLSTLGVNSSFFSDGVATNPFTNSASSWFTYTNPALHCPQCRTPMLFSQKPSLLLSLNNVVRQVGRLGMKYGLLTYIGSGALATLITTGIATMTSIGFGLIWQQLAPQSVILKILGITGVNTFDKALDRGKIGLSDLGLIAGAPLYLLGLRGGHYSRGGSEGLHPVLGFSALYPLLFYVKDATVLSSWGTLYASKDPRNWLLYVDPLSFIYDVCYSLTLNRLYYRWCLTVKPWYIKNRLTKEEVTIIEEEDAELTELQELRYQREESENQSTLKRLRNLIIPKVTKRERQLLNNRSEREQNSIFKQDYTSPFIQDSPLLTLLTTLTWPTLGFLLNQNVLSRFSFIRSFLNAQSNTPDEATYLGNLIACCGVVLLKDLVNLGLVYLKYRQLRDIDIVEAKNFTAENGFKLTVRRENDDREQVVDNDPEPHIHDGDVVDAVPADNIAPNIGTPSTSDREFLDRLFNIGGTLLNESDMEYMGAQALARFHAPTEESRLRQAANNVE